MAEDDVPSGNEKDQSGVKTVGRFEHYSCAISSFVLAAFLAILFYPLLVTLTTPFGILSTTALVLTIIAVWSVGWIGFELLWERHADQEYTPQK